MADNMETEKSYENNGETSQTQLAGSELSRLLHPISEEFPSGEYLIYEGTYDQIREARREEDADIPQGVWERSLKKADWKNVKDICWDALEKQTKDLQIAAWMLEAMLHLEGFNGAAKCIQIITSLCELFWDSIYPEIDDDMDARLSPIIWMNEKLSLKLKLEPITMPTKSADSSSYTFADWEKANILENLPEKDKKEVRGGVTRAKFLGSVMFTPISYYKEQSRILTESISKLKGLGGLLDEKCGKEAPSLKIFQDTLEGILELVNNFLKEKKEQSSEPEPSNKQKDKDVTENLSPDKGASTLTIRSRSEAYRILSEVSDYLMIKEPHSPTPYLVKRAVSWGKMPLSELLKELVNNDGDLSQIFKLLGMQNPGD